MRTIWWGSWWYVLLVEGNFDIPFLELIKGDKK